MQPQSPQNQAGVPAHLPPLAPMGPQQPTPPPASQTPPASVPMSEQVRLRAKQVVAQYQNSPYQLSGALQQLKSEYLAKQFNVTVNSVEN